MGAPKPLLDIGGVTFVARLVDTLRRGGCAPVIVVAAARSGALAAEAVRCGGRLVVNSGGAGGQIGSLRTALHDLLGLEDPPRAIVFTPVDNPAVMPGTIGKLIEAWQGSRASIVMPRYGGERGHPVLADMTIAEEFLEPGLEQGARTVVRRDAARVLEVPVEDAGTVDDIDTPRRYRAWFGRRELPEAGAREADRGCGKAGSRADADQGYRG